MPRALPVTLVVTGMSLGRTGFKAPLKSGICSMPHHHAFVYSLHAGRKERRKEGSKEGGKQGNNNSFAWRVPSHYKYLPSFLTPIGSALLCSDARALIILVYKSLTRS